MPAPQNPFEECKFNLMPVHWLDKVIYEDGECTIYHGKGQLRKKLASGICQIRADELMDRTDLSQLGRIYEYYHSGRRIFTHGLVEEHVNGTGVMPGGRKIVALS